MSTQEKETFIDKFQRIVMPIGTKIAGQRHLASVSGGIMMTIPLTLFSAFVNILANPPVTEALIEQGGIWSIFSGWFYWATANKAAIMVPYNMTMEIFSLVAVIGISYQLAKSYKMKAVSATVISVVAFLVVAAPAYTNEAGVLTMSLSNLGSKGLFGAIIVSLITIEIIRFVEKKNWTIKLPDSVPPNVAEPFSSIIPAALSILFWYGVSLLSQQFLGVLFPEIITQLLTPVFAAVVNVYTMPLIIAFACILWLFGIHGTNIVYAALMPYMMQNALSNAAAYATSGASGLVLYPTAMMGFMAIGGTGCTLGLCILMMRSKSAQLKTIGRLSVVPGICGINEPVIFGVPVVLNPTLAIPFVLIPVLSAILGYVALSFGIIDIGHNVVMALLPIGVGSFLSTMSWKNPLFEVFLALIQIPLWYPFFKAYEKQLLVQEAEYEKEHSEA